MLIIELPTPLTGYPFVDDTDMLHTQHEADEPITELVDEFEGSLDMWQGTLRSSSGALDCNNPNKSYWCNIYYEWNSNGR